MLKMEIYLPSWFFLIRSVYLSKIGRDDEFSHGHAVKRKI